MLFAEKCIFFAFFLYKNLHISKICCNFAPSFKKGKHTNTKKKTKKTNKIMTRAQLQLAAETLGAKFEINPRYSEQSYYNYETKKFEKIQTGWYFGINNLSGRDSWSWTWFETIGMNDDEFWFVERYSMRTGKSNKGWRERMTAHERVANLLGISFDQLFNF